jgi:hypothetical protein
MTHTKESDVIGGALTFKKVISKLLKNDAK